MNFLQLAQRLHVEQGGAGNGPTAYSGADKTNLRKFYWIADAWLAIQNMDYGWKWMRRSGDGLVTGASMSYSGADLGLTGFGKFREPTDDYTVRCYDPSNTESVWRLKWVPYDRFVTTFMDVEMTAAAPQFWSISPLGALVIAPRPDGAYMLKTDYTIEPTVLDADEDVPDLPSKYHMILVWRALTDAGAFAAAPEVLSRASERYNEMESQLILDQGEPITITARPL